MNTLLCNSRLKELVNAADDLLDNLFEMDQHMEEGRLLHDYKRLRRVTDEFLDLIANAEQKIREEEKRIEKRDNWEPADIADADLKRRRLL